MGQHSEFSPSSIERLIKCPGSKALIAKAPKPIETIYAVEGTTAHTLGEMCLREWSTKPGQYKDKKICIDPETGREKKVTAQMVIGVQKYLDAIYEIIDKTDVEKKRKEIYIEERVYVKTAHPDMYGTSDCIIYDVKEKTLYVIDYKNGGKEVPVEYNAQLMSYAAGAMELMVGYNKKAPVKLFNKIVLMVVQPNSIFSGPVKTWETDPQTIIDWVVSELKPAIENSLKPDAPLACGKHCMYCPARAMCPEQMKKAIEIAKADFTSGEITPPAVNALTDEQIVNVLKYSDVLESWLKEVKSYALREAKSGHNYDGYKLVAVKGKRKLHDNVEIDLELELGDEIYNKKLKGLGELEQLYRESTGCTAKEAKAYITTLCYVPDGGEALVPDSDKRPAIIPPAESDFMDDMASELEDLFS